MLIYSIFWYSTKFAKLCCYENVLLLNDVCKTEHDNLCRCCTRIKAKFKELKLKLIHISLSDYSYDYNYIIKTNILTIYRNELSHDIDSIHRFWLIRKVRLPPSIYIYIIHLHDYLMSILRYCHTELQSDFLQMSVCT